VQPPAAPAVAIAWPDGGFDWNDQWRKKLPVVRGIHAPAQIDGKALLAEPIALQDDSHGFHAAELAELAKAAQRSRGRVGLAPVRGRITG
jgi:hypothetical protein